MYIENTSVLKIGVAIVCLLIYTTSFASPQRQQRDDSMKVIKIHFLYGSKPGKKYTDVEKRWFGGLHGGHVSIETAHEVTGFGPWRKFHVFGRKKDFHSQFSAQQLTDWVADSSGMKYVSVTIPLTYTQYQELTAIHTQYQLSAPYDYAFLGMRCAAATYEILSRLKLVPVYRRNGMVTRYFYPKLLRKKILKLAKERGYSVHYQQGRTTRIWERD